MNEALWFAAGFLLFRLASRCKLLPTRFGPSQLFPKLQRSKNLEAMAEHMAREEPQRPGQKAFERPWKVRKGVKTCENRGF